MFVISWWLSSHCIFIGLQPRSAEFHWLLQVCRTPGYNIGLHLGLCWLVEFPGWSPHLILFLHIYLGTVPWGGSRIFHLWLRWTGYSLVHTLHLLSVYVLIPTYFFWRFLWFLRDHSPQWHTEKEAAASKSRCQNSLVFAPHRESEVGFHCSLSYQTDSVQASLKWPESDLEDPDPYSHGSGTIPLALCELPTYQQKDGAEMRHLQGVLDYRYASQKGIAFPNVQCQDLQGSAVQLGSMGGRRSLVAWADAPAWAPQYIQRNLTLDRIPLRLLMVHRFQEGESAKARAKARGKGRARQEQRSERDQRLAFQDPCTRHGALAIVGSCSWHRECVAALMRNAYPDGATVPAETKELIDKLDEDIERL